MSDTVYATDVHRVLALFAQGLAGRNLQLTPHDAAGRASVIGTDGDTIGVPAEIGDFTNRRHNFGAYLVTVLHQVGQLGLGTFDFSANYDFDAAPDPALLRLVFEALEDRRIDVAVRRRYPGAGADLDRVLAHELARRPPLMTLPWREALIEIVVQYSLGAPPVAKRHDDAAGVQQQILRLATVVDAESAGAEDSLRAARTICALIATAATRSPSGPPSEMITIELIPATEDSNPTEIGGGSTDSERDGHGQATDEIDGPGIALDGTLTGDDLRERGAEGRAGTLPEQFIGSMDPTMLVPDVDESGVDPTAASRPRLVGRQQAFEGDRIFLYDEWDHISQNYLPAWCRLYEHRLRGDDHQFLAGVRRRHADLAHRVRRTFSSVRPESWQRVHSTSDGEELDLDAVITAMVDRRAGHVTEENFYIRRERGLREVAAAFLLDISASTSAPIVDPNAEPEPPKTLEEEEDEWFHTFSRDGRDGTPSTPERRVLDIAKDAIALMGDALQILGDDHAIYGFSGEGRDNVEFYVAKEFRDAPSARAWAGLAAMEPRRYTRMGPAIRHAATKLVAQPARTKVLIVVSDGYPQDKDYGPLPGDSEYGLHDTARALLEAERAHISTFCVTVDPAGHDYLRRMCAEDRYLVIDDVTALPEELSKIYRALTGARSRTAR